MKDKFLKKPACRAVEQEMKNLPEETALSKVFTFSESFEKRMSSIFRYVKNSYINLFGIVFPKRYMYPVLSVVIIVLMYFRRSLRNTGLRVIPVLLLLIARSIRRNTYTVENSGGYDPYRQLHKNLQPGYTFIDTAQAGNTQAALDYALPDVPAGYVKKEEVRLASRHTAVFENTTTPELKICYEKMVKNSAALPKIPRDDVNPLTTPLNYSKGIFYVKERETHLIFEDGFFLYHFYGTADLHTLQAAAFGEKQ